MAAALAPVVASIPAAVVVLSLGAVLRLLLLLSLSVLLVLTRLLPTLVVLVVVAVVDWVAVVWAALLVSFVLLFFAMYVFTDSLIARFNQQQGNFGPIAPPAKFDQRADQSKAAHCSVSADSSKDEIIGFGGARCGIGRDNGVPLNPFAALEDFGEGGSNKTKDADDAYEDDANKDLD